MRLFITALTKVASMSALTAYAFIVLVGLIGPGGVEQQVGWPHDRNGPVALDRSEFPHCVEPDAFEGIPATAVIVTDRGVAREVPWASAWKRNNDGTTVNNVRVLGSCA